MPHRIMAHLVAYYPDREGSLETARGLIDGGVGMLEVQFPFSDPTADGPYIQEACRTALEAGFKVSRGFQLVEEIGRIAAGRVPVFVMGYANTVFFRGVEAFVGDAMRSGARGLIIPDLPPDSDEGLFAAGERAGVEAVPVVAPSIEDGRLGMILSLPSEHIYASLRAGITGDYTRIGDRNLGFLRRIGTAGKKILAGFGISERAQVEALSPHVYAIVVGSAFIKGIMGRENRSIYGEVRRLIERLL